ncbi:MAG: phosphate/phosphonate ABC transporter permease [Oscillospiraceae bacterium]|nr:phosphate/phosphonate ABC transporter permease [Oscillospiraceae bacterium]
MRSKPISPLKESEESEKTPLSNQPKRRVVTITTLCLAVVAAAFIFLGIDLWDVFMAFPAFGSFFVTRFMPPNLGAIPNNINLIVDTIFFAVAGTGISSVLALACGLLLSEKTNSIAWLRLTVRFTLSILRNVPVLVWASLLIFIFGIGSIVGLIAIIFATLGFLARSYAESMSEVAGEKIEALRAVGASKAQMIFHGILPEFIPAWVNWTLFTFEINLRASAILGMVGAGGIGIVIQSNLRLFRYHNALALIATLTAMILLTEFLTNRLRGKVK